MRQRYVKCVCLMSHHLFQTALSDPKHPSGPAVNKQDTATPLENNTERIWRTRAQREYTESTLVLEDDVYAWRTCILHMTAVTGRVKSALRVHAATATNSNEAPKCFFSATGKSRKGSRFLVPLRRSLARFRRSIHVLRVALPFAGREG